MVDFPRPIGEGEMLTTEAESFVIDAVN